MVLSATSEHSENAQSEHRKKREEEDRYRREAESLKAENAKREAMAQAAFRELETMKQRQVCRHFL